MTNSVSSIITLTTDFGLTDGYVGAMKGAILSVNSQCQLVDISHAVSPQDVSGGARVLLTACPFYPLGTVHVAVIDPGVGTRRSAVAIRAGGHYFVGPDNGLFAPVIRKLGIERVVRLENADFFRRDVSSTFHGRDIFGPVAGHLSAGVDIGALGPQCELVETVGEAGVERRADGQLIGVVTHVDHFGNLITNIDGTQFSTLPERVTYGVSKEASYVTTYGEGQAGEIIALVGSSGLLELALPNGNAAQSLHAGAGLVVEVKLK